MEKDDLKQKLKNILEEKFEEFLDKFIQERTPEFKEAEEGMNKVFIWAFNFLPSSEEGDEIIKSTTMEKRFSEIHPELPTMPTDEYDANADIMIKMYHATKWYYKTIGKEEV